MRPGPSRSASSTPTRPMRTSGSASGRRVTRSPATTCCSATNRSSSSSSASSPGRSAPTGKRGTSRASASSVSYAAIDRFDPESSIDRFPCYATARIRGAIYDELRRLDWLPRSVRNALSEYQSTADELGHRLGREPGSSEVLDTMGVLGAARQAVLSGVQSSQLLHLDRLVEVEGSRRRDPARRRPARGGGRRPRGGRRRVRGGRRAAPCRRRAARAAAPRHHAPPVRGVHFRADRPATRRHGVTRLPDRGRGDLHAARAPRSVRRRDPARRHHLVPGPERFRRAFAAVPVVLSRECQGGWRRRCARPTSRLFPSGVEADLIPGAGVDVAQAAPAAGRPQRRWRSERARGRVLSLGGDDEVARVVGVVEHELAESARTGTRSGWPRSCRWA